MGGFLELVESWSAAAVRRAWGWLSKKISRLSADLDVISLVLLLTAGLLTLAHTNDYPDKESWEGGTLVTLQVLAAACRQVAAYIDWQCPKLPLRYVGVHIWLVSGPFFAKHLRRRARFLLIGERAQSGIRWTKGKGVVGAAWARGTGVVKNIDGIRERASSQAQYEGLPFDDRLGLTWEEFRKTPQYAAIYAAPLFDRSKTSADPEVLGVVAIDILHRGHFRTLKKATHSEEFASIIGVCETALGRSEEGA